jgi:Beta protein
MRGEAPRGKAGSESAEPRPGLEQWNGHAQILCDSPDLFYGEDFSWGDHFIYEMSQDTRKTGSYEIWLRAGINHNLTVVSRQIANLCGL